MSINPIFGNSPDINAFTGKPKATPFFEEEPLPEPPAGTFPEDEEETSEEATVFSIPAIAVKVTVGGSFAGESVSLTLESYVQDHELEVVYDSLLARADKLVQSRIEHLRATARPTGGLPDVPATQGFVQQAPTQAPQQYAAQILPQVGGGSQSAVAGVAAGTHTPSGPVLRKMEAPNGKGFVTWYDTNVVSTEDIVEAFTAWAHAQGLAPESFRIFDNRTGYNALEDGSYSPFAVALKLVEGAKGFNSKLLKTNTGKPAVIAKADFSKTAQGPKVEFKFLANYNNYRAALEEA